MVAVVTGELSPTVAGTVYCGMIEICQEIAELRRAQEWTEALTAERALERFARAADQYATGAACCQQAELYRLCGDFTAAEDAYQQASRWGRQPQLGLALLRLAQGETEVAAAASRRVVAETSERSGGPSCCPPTSRSC